MKAEAWAFWVIALFFVPVTAIYWLMSHDPTGTTALIMAFLLALMVAVYLQLVARRMDPRPEDRKSGDIAEGAGELGFYPPHSIWPLFNALTFLLVILSPIFGWWLLLIGLVFGTVTLTGWLYEYYRGDYAH